MPDQSVTDRKDPAAFSQHNQVLQDGLAKGGKPVIELG
jgi:hypothetical protein